jgi:hypothetical protein
MSARRAASSLLILAALGAPAVQAQDATPNGLAGLLLNFFSASNPVILQANPVPAFSHEAHFRSQPNAQETLRQLNRGIASQISTFPLGSSAASFTYTLDPALGVYNRSTESFGPVFGERPITAGKGKFSFGVNYLNATYDKFEGQELENDDIQLYLIHQDPAGDGQLGPWFEGDIIRADLSLSLEQHTTALFANYGITDRLDIGVAVPFQHLSLDARIHTSIEHLATDPDATQAKLAVIAGKFSGRFTPRASAGYTFSSGGADFLGELPDEVSYSAGFDAVLHSRVTLTADFLGRTLLDADRLVERERVFQYTQRTDPTVRQTTRLTPVSETGNLNLFLVSTGLKVNPVGRLLLVGNVLFAVGDDGLQDEVTPSFGLEYSF